MKRQTMLARAARREALSAMADATLEETRSARLAARSRELARADRHRGGAMEAGALRNLSTFAASLETLARNAERAREWSAEQASLQARTLSSAETRERRMDERLEAAREALFALEERKSTPVPEPLARGLQRTKGTGGRSSRARRNEVMQ